MFRLFRNNDGSSAIEFAFAAPPVILALFGSLELLIVLFVGSTLESAVLDASRFGITGGAQPGITREDQVRAIIEDRTMGLVDMSKATIDTLTYSNFDDVGKPEPYVDASPGNGTYDSGEAFTDINGNGQWDSDMGTAGMGGPGDVVLYTVSANWNMMTPLISALAPNNGLLTLQSSIVVRNEAFPAP